MMHCMTQKAPKVKLHGLKAVLPARENFPDLL